MPRSATQVREARALEGPAFLLRRGEIVPAEQKKTAIEGQQPEVEVRAPELPVATARSFRVFE